MAAGLGKQILAEPRAYGKIIDAAIARRGSDLNKAMTLLMDANTLFDTWIGHFDLGRIYLDAAIAAKDLGLFAQADSEFDKCFNRRGEALSVFLDEEPTSGYFPPLLYYRARARQGVNQEGASDALRRLSRDPRELQRRSARAGSSQARQIRLTAPSRA